MQFWMKYPFFHCLWIYMSGKSVWKRRSNETTSTFATINNDYTHIYSFYSEDTIDKYYNNLWIHIILNWNDIESPCNWVKIILFLLRAQLVMYCNCHTNASLSISLSTTAAQLNGSIWIRDEYVRNRGLFVCWFICSCSGKEMRHNIYD